MRARIAVLASGGGSNAGAILAHFASLGDAANGEVVLIGSDQPSAGALDRARAAGVAHASFDARDGAALLALLEAHHADIVVLAGYLRLVPTEVVARFRGRMLNVHPGPLPDFGGRGMYGEHVHSAVLAAGRAETAVTIHLVDEEYDRGVPIARWPVPIEPADTPATLAARVLAVEHVVFPRIIDALAALVRASPRTSDINSQ